MTRRKKSNDLDILVGEHTEYHQIPEEEKDAHDPTSDCYCEPVLIFQDADQGSRVWQHKLRH